MSERIFQITEEQVGLTLAAVLRQQLPGSSWNQVRKWISDRQVTVGENLCTDSAMRMTAGMSISLSHRPAPEEPKGEMIHFRYVDEHIVVVEKPYGMNTIRHPAELEWSKRKQAQNPTLLDLVYKKLSAQEKATSPKNRLRVVQRLDKETSGLLVFARTHVAERELGKQFQAHQTHRKYLAIIPGQIRSQTISTHLVRNRGDGLRGSSESTKQGKLAVTHIQHLESLGRYSLVACRLETGRTHQIRIHLSEAGHPICGEKVYIRRRNGSIIREKSRAPRLALHAAELGFVHPVTREQFHWESEFPKDLQFFLHSLRGNPGDSDTENALEE